MKTTILYHQNCLDGFGAAMVALLNFRSEGEVRLVPWQYQTPCPVLDEMVFERVVVLDVSGDRDEMEALAHRSVEMWWLDHHAISASTTRAAVGGGAKVVLSSTDATCVLAWKTFFPESNWIPPVLRHVQDYDLWLFDLRGTREVCERLRLLGWVESAWLELLSDEGDEVERLENEGRLLVAARDNEVERIAKNVAVQARLRLAMVNSTVWPNEVAELVLDLHEEVDVVGVWYARRGLVKWSLRARKNTVPVNELAAIFGGGGHACAAGCVMECTPMAHDLRLSDALETLQEKGGLTA
ncbi:MAG: DHHA1 domain-containing protein [Verrucomicrobiota bacterium]